MHGVWGLGLGRRKPWLPSRIAHKPKPLRQLTKSFTPPTLQRPPTISTPSISLFRNPPTSHKSPNFTMSNVVVNVSSDLLWAITRNNSSYIVKRGVGNERAIFSKEPLNLTNKHSRKYSGLVNEKAVGVQANENGGVTLITKKSHEKYGSKPASLYDTTAFSKNKSQRKTYVAIVNRVAKKYYRPDLRQEAVARASAIMRSQRPVKPTPASKPRGVKAKAAAEKA